MLGRDYTVDAREQEAGGLTFTTAPVRERTQISGSMNLHLYVSTSGNEGTWAVTVNDVAPDGTSTVLTNGALTVSNRAFDKSRSEYAADGTLLSPYHHLSRRRKLPVPADVPVPNRHRPGAHRRRARDRHRLRVDVYASSSPAVSHGRADLLRARGRRQALVLDAAHPSHLSFLAIGAPGW